MYGGERQSYAILNKLRISAMCSRNSFVVSKLVLYFISIWPTVKHAADKINSVDGKFIYASSSIE
jgi:hypothetical protein